MELKDLVSASGHVNVGFGRILHGVESHQKMVKTLSPSISVESFMELKVKIRETHS
ncbi:hypothetical protein Mcup_1097 [Metallosphaera cuprina Ar-4]|uniref:Uncharacterized protein n=1 Tax=Metallosphaera cuprina (strain Ar-4) TaxID=1006006 RepID=F4G304_METCR|nr:hypothetical protein Mcup_1097 [Metallosphaera cuprina Ar-4]